MANGTSSSDLSTDVLPTPAHCQYLIGMIARNIMLMELSTLKLVVAVEARANRIRAKLAIVATHFVPLRKTFGEPLVETRRCLPVSVR